MIRLFKGLKDLFECSLFDWYLTHYQEAGRLIENVGDWDSYTKRSLGHLFPFLPLAVVSQGQLSFPGILPVKTVVFSWFYGGTRAVLFESLC